jgi:hypothetical protein
LSLRAGFVPEIQKGNSDFKLGHHPLGCTVDSPAVHPIASRLSRARARFVFPTQNILTWP